MFMYNYGDTVSQTFPLGSHGIRNLVDIIWISKEIVSVYCIYEFVFLFLLFIDGCSITIRYILDIFIYLLTISFIWCEMLSVVWFQCHSLVAYFY